MVVVVPLNLLDRIKRRDADDDGSYATGHSDDVTFVTPMEPSPGTRFTAIPRLRRQDTPAERKAKMMVWGMLAALPVALLALVVALGAAATGGGTGPAPTAGSGGYRYTGAARIAAVDYLAGVQSKVPVAPGIDWVSARSGGADAKKTAPKPIAYSDLVWDRAQAIIINGVGIEVHTFLVVSGNGLQELTVPIAERGGGAVVASLPSLGVAQPGTPVADADLRWSKVYALAPLTPTSRARIQKWFEAFASGDSATLYDLTGDPGLHTYPGLGGYRVDGAVDLAPAADRGKGYFLVTVTANLVANSDPDLRLRLSYDLLLGNTTSATVTIVSWGPVGSGPGLMPFDTGLAPQS